MRLTYAVPLAAAYIATVVLANVLTEHYGLVPVGFGLTATAGTFAAGATLLARNLAQDVTGRLLVLGLMLVGCGLSWWLASPQLATASACAFALSETADMAVYSPLRDRARRTGSRTGWSRAVLAASIVGAVVDTFVFLHVAGFPLTADSVTGQLVVKIGISAVVAAAGVARAVLRQPVNAERA
ncbi:MAG TPA: VUT family protein [Jatrophihabitantaceae bacterium]|jgi:hypothetical protein